MFYDLNVPWPAVEPPPGAAPPSKKAKKAAAQTASGAKPAPGDELLGEAALQRLPAEEQGRLKELAYELASCTCAFNVHSVLTGSVGYGTVAFNHMVATRFDAALHANPFRTTGNRPHPPFPQLDPRVRGAGKEARGLVQLSRLTVLLDQDSIKGGSGFVAANSTALQQYDLLAARPLTEAAFQHACITMSELKPFSVDIISLDLAAAPRLPFYLKRSTVGAALANGVVFEVEYSAATGDAGSGDAKARRRNMISGAREILRATNARGVIFTSGAQQALGLRAPYDVMNLAAVMGMSAGAAKEALSSACHSLCLRAQTRQTFRGVISRPTLESASTADTRASGGASVRKRKLDA